MQCSTDRRQFLNALLGSSAALGLGAALAGCSGTPIAGVPTGALGSQPGGEAVRPKGLPGEAVKIGLLLPLSAGPPTGDIAKALQKAAELALFERSGANLQLVVKDDRGTSEGAKAAATEAVKAGVELIIGPVFAKSVQAAAPVARAAGIHMIGFSNDRSVVAPGVHILSFLIESEVQRSVGHAVQQGRRRFAAFVSDDLDGRRAEAALRDALSRAGGQLVTVERYHIEQSGLISAEKRLKEVIGQARGEGGDDTVAFDALFLPAGQDTLPQLSALLGRARLDTSRVKLIGTSGWDYPGVSRDARLRGAWFAAPEPRGWQTFAERFSKAYGQMPPRLASLAWDGVEVAAALAHGPKGARFAPAALTRSTGYSGVDGLFRFTGDGLVERGLAVLELQAAGPVVIAAAPSGFAGPTARGQDVPERTASRS